MAWPWDPVTDPTSPPWHRKREGGINHWAPLHRTRRGLFLWHYMWCRLSEYYASDLSLNVHGLPSVSVWVNSCVSVCVRVSVSACDRLSVIRLAHVIVTVCVCVQQWVSLEGSEQCKSFPECSRHSAFSTCPDLCTSIGVCFRYFA